MAELSTQVSGATAAAATARVRQVGRLVDLLEISAKTCVEVNLPFADETLVCVLDGTPNPLAGSKQLSTFVWRRMNWHVLRFRVSAPASVLALCSCFREQWHHSSILLESHGEARHKRCFLFAASVFGRVALSGSAPYSISKFGVEAYSDCLRYGHRSFPVTNGE